MTYDGKILALARDDIAARRQKNESEHQRRRAEVFSRQPALHALEAETTRLMTGVAVSALKKGENAGAAVKNAHEQVAVLEKRRAHPIVLRRLGKLALQKLAGDHDHRSQSGERRIEPRVAGDDGDSGHMGRACHHERGLAKRRIDTGNPGLADALLRDD